MKRAALRAGRRAICAPEDARVAPRKTCRLHVGRRAGARRVRAGCAPFVRARGAGRPVRPCSSRSSLPKLRGRAAGGRRHTRHGPHERRASPALPRAAKFEPKPERTEVPPGFAVLFQRQKESEAKHTKKRDASVPESGVRAGARTYCCRNFLESEIIVEGVQYFRQSRTTYRLATAKEERQSLPHPTLFLS